VLAWQKKPLPALAHRSECQKTQALQPGEEDKKQHKCIKVRITSILYLYCIEIVQLHYDLIRFYLKELKLILKIYSFDSFIKY